MLPKDPLDYFGDWECLQCKAKQTGPTIYAMVKAIESEADEKKKDLDLNSCEERIRNWTKVLHPQNYIIMLMKRRLLDLYLQYPDPEDAIELRCRLERMVELGHEVLKVVSVLERGYSLGRGRALRNLHQPTLKLAKLNLQERKISKAEFIEITKNAIRNMKEAVKCLEDFEKPEDTILPPPELK